MLQQILIARDLINDYFAHEQRKHIAECDRRSKECDAAVRANHERLLAEYAQSLKSLRVEHEKALKGASDQHKKLISQAEFSVAALSWGIAAHVCAFWYLSYFLTISHYIAFALISIFTDWIIIRFALRSLLKELMKES